MISKINFARNNALSKDNSSTSKQNNVETNSIDEEIKERLKKLKQSASSNIEVSNKDIAERLQKLKQDSVSSNDVKLNPSLASASGSSVTVLDAKVWVLLEHIFTVPKLSYIFIYQRKRNLEKCCTFILH